MIVRPGDAALHLITQPDHAALAGRVMDDCVPLRSRPRRGSILRAIAEHDNGWRELDASPLVDAATGRVYDFVHLPAPLRQAVWPRGVGRLADDPWAAALVAQHAITVYDRYRGDPEWTSFFAEMASLRTKLIEAACGTLAGLGDDYKYVRLGDLLSLVFCAGWVEPQHFERWTIRLEGSRVTVSPALFDRDQPIEVPARAIADTAYHSDEQLRATLGSAATVMLRGIVAAQG